MSKQTRKYQYSFLDAGVPANAGTADSGPFRKVLSGTGTAVKTVNGLELRSSGGVGVSALSFGDALAWDIDEIIRVEFLTKLIVATSIAASRVFVGLATARNDDANAIAQHAHFSAAGTTELLLETDDAGTNDIDDIESGLLWESDWQRLAIDLATGIKSQVPPFLSAGGKGSVLFYAGNPNQALRHVGRTTGFDLSAYTGGFQPLLQVNNGGSGDNITLCVREIDIELKVQP